MQLPTIDRIQHVRPLAVESASLVTGRVVPVAPVNATLSNNTATEPSPGVVNLINQVDKPDVGEGVYSSVADPARHGSEAAAAKDWTLQHPAPEKTEIPPPDPLYKVLLDHIKSLWLASAGAIQVQQQVKDQIDMTQSGVNAPQGALSTEVFTYSPTKITRAEAPKS